MAALGEILKAGLMVPLVDDREEHRAEVWVRAVRGAAVPAA